MRRLQGAEPAADGGAQVAGVVAGPRRLPAVRDDVRQLPEAARLQRRRRDARQAAPRRLRGAALVPPVVSGDPPSPSPDPRVHVQSRLVIVTRSQLPRNSGAQAPRDSLCAIR